MTPEEYRQMLLDAIEKKAFHPEGPREEDTVLSLVGSTRGLGARGEHVGFTDGGERVTLFSRAEVRRMLAKLNKVSGGTGVREYRPTFLMGERPDGQ